MPKTSRKAFQSALVQVEKNIRTKVDGEFRDDWQLVNSLHIHISPVSTAANVEHTAANERTYYVAFAKENPGLTVDHRIRYEDKVLYCEGMLVPAPKGIFYKMLFVANAVDQPNRFMTMEGLGLLGAADITYRMGGGTSLSGSSDPTYLASGGGNIAGNADLVILMSAKSGLAGAADIIQQMLGGCGLVGAADVMHLMGGGCGLAGNADMIFLGSGGMDIAGDADMEE